MSTHQFYFTAIYSHNKSSFSIKHNNIKLALKFVTTRPCTYHSSRETVHHLLSSRLVPTKTPSLSLSSLFLSLKMKKRPFRKDIRPTRSHPQPRLPSLSPLSVYFSLTLGIVPKFLPRFLIKKNFSFWYIQSYIRIYVYTYIYTRTLYSFCTYSNWIIGGAPSAINSAT